VDTYNIALGVAEQRSMSDKACELFEEMKKRNIKPNIATFNSLMRTLAKGGELKKALTTVTQTMPESKIPLDKRTIESTMLAFYYSNSLGNSVGLFEHWLNQIDPNLKLDFKASSSTDLWLDPAHQKEWFQLLGMVNKLVLKDKEYNELSTEKSAPSIFSFGGVVRACEKIEWKSLDQGVDRGEFQGGQTARVLVDIMREHFKLKPGRIILGLCLNACLKQLQNDKYQMKNLDNRDVMLENTFRTIEELKQLEDFDIDATQKQLIQAVGGGVNEVEPILKEFNSLIETSHTLLK
jgi:pentatricopeptide repeat protein